ncbi:MAG: DUF3144 domain-containing protein [Candidatus Thiodiazotropha sp. (ex Ctena orbiculata)]|uniref:DUF3144 domain-containing protein n=1 Tax=Candidatus Thiodiazotropha taylori TaxID=2792791 RepID=A0A9E4N8S1_9GAMM|nr:DUF3144 domain-containing protein [Candidatus Thiodiazotropha taylori]RLW53357.1 MAG: hypothetical protein B6D76_11770 [gamma proteobacterium symbiont of Stewartia floridana]MCG7896764.1 DUF3144 domain-containing protein [Candidatus Thiodiazotropha taylori]MCG7909478.1 DUF3144 domain-containing protein [Candidatus Thiodiazotropha taylori]MCG7942919.1 DUF3144 domain-containing protein [Candidatus Thiodiazotropha taylori]
MSEKADIEEFTALASRFIELANKMKEEGKPVQMVNAALMSASATYGTYIHAGNEGYLQPSGVKKLVDTYSNQVENIQKIKKQATEQG